MRVLLTGAAGFIGFHVAKRLLARGDSVIGFDNMNDYYDPSLKRARIDVLTREAGQHGSEFSLVVGDVADRVALAHCFRSERSERVIHLAAQAGVRHSLRDPHAYVDSNIVGFTNVLEACRHAKVPHLTYASTSSVYGGNTRTPFSEHRGVDHPLQFYAATKRANELMAHAYSHLFRLPTTGLRFFTVYGPWGRPDMALFLFTRAILQQQPLQVFNHGRHVRDFTYVDDIAEAVVRASDRIPAPNADWDGRAPDPATSTAPFRIYNVGNSDPVKLMDYIYAIEDALGMKAMVEYLPLQPGDVPETVADVSDLERDLNFRPQVGYRDGVARFVEWYCEYYGR